MLQCVSQHILLSANMLQRVLQSVQRCSVLPHVAVSPAIMASFSVLQCALQCVAVCVAACAAVCCSVLQCVAMCCSVVQCVAVCCSVLQCVAVCCSVSHLPS